MIEERIWIIEKMIRVLFLRRIERLYQFGYSKRYLIIYPVISFMLILWYNFFGGDNDGVNENRY